MSHVITELGIKNYRSIADVSLRVGPLTVFFGPNGGGKSSILDVLWFLRDCSIRGVEFASSERSHGIGLLYDGAPQGDPISITLATSDAEYQVRLGLSSGRIEAFPGERLYSSARNQVLIERPVGSDSASFYHANVNALVVLKPPEPEKLSLGLYLLFEDALQEAAHLDGILKRIHFYNSRAFNIYRIRTVGSDARTGRNTWLSEHADNLWSVLRNLHDRQAIDNRYSTIMQFMKKAFPAFDGLLVEETGTGVVYGSLLDRNRREPILASGVSDGHLQMLILLTSLFAEPAAQESIILLDEPETSLHPWPIAVLAEAIQLACSEWHRQILLATHSPVLLSQFDVKDVVATELVNGQTNLTRLSEMDAIKDLLDEYATGSLYMANMIAPQGESNVIEEAA